MTESPPTGGGCGCGWPTVFVIGQQEVRPKQAFAAFTEGGRVMLYLKDTFSETSVVKTFHVAKVIFDVYSNYQYVHLGVFDG